MKLAAELKLSRFRTVDEPAVVISCSDPDCIEISSDILTYRLFINEIHRGPCHRCTFSERNLRFVCRKIFRTVHPEGMSENVSVAFAVQIEIAMVGKVYDCRCIRFCSICHAKLAVVCPLVAYNRLDSSGIALLAIFRIVHELHSAFNLTAFPHLALKTFRTAMEMVRTTVHRKGVFLSFKGELAGSDTVRISSRSLSEARAVAYVAGRFSITERNISHVSVLVGNNCRNDCRTYASKLYICAF